MRKYYQHKTSAVKGFRDRDVPREKILPIEAFVVGYKPKNQIRLLEIISQIIWYGAKESEKASLPLRLVRSVRHSLEWAKDKIGCNKVTLGAVRNDLEWAGLLTQREFSARPKGQTPEGEVDFLSPITMLSEVDFVGLANLARRLVASIVCSLGFEAIERDHGWGFLANAVQELTGHSLFSMDDEYIPEPKAEPIPLKATADWPIVGQVKKLVSVLDLMAQKFGPDWPSALPF